jgi:acetolactate synthase I/II/III large subunit
MPPAVRRNNMSVSETPRADAATKTGGQVLVECLRTHGVDRVFCVPGESYLDVLDALHDEAGIEIVVCKHEGAAANMAEADGKLTGAPGVCFVTRGPGATHAAVGVHTAMQDSTPMVLFIGQVDRGFRDREGFQEVDYRAMFGPLAKWVGEIDDPSRVREYVARAFQIATSGRRGPVVLSLPEDMLADTSAPADLTPGRFREARSAPVVADLRMMREQIERADRPLLILGGSGWSEVACRDIKAFAEANHLPVAVSFRRQDLFDNRHANYAGHLGLGVNPRLAQHVGDADLLIVVGTRMSEVSSDGYTLVESPRPRQRLVHVHPDPEELGRVYQPDVAINSGVGTFCASLAALRRAANAHWESWTRKLNADYVKFTLPPPPSADHDGVHLATVISRLSAALPDDAIVSNGAGNYTVWVHRFHQYREFRTELAPISGAMGYGLPAAIAAKLRHPERTVVCFAGDGCFLMYPQELGTAVAQGAAIVVIVVNNGMYGTIRMHQERRFPGRVSATKLLTPDFVALARSFGAHGECVERTEDFAAAFDRARSAGVPALIELRVDPRQITPGVRLPATADVHHRVRSAVS